jgi:GNAT superfamily N-acetyltransferase
MPGYHVRSATVSDIDVLVHHRLGMFADMGTPIADGVAGAFRQWLEQMLPADAYKAWLVQTDDGHIVAGGGLTILPWPPGPNGVGSRVAFVYNVYTEPEHRHRGLARTVMIKIHDWCRENEVGAVMLNASQAGRPLYESIGYRLTVSPMMFLAVEA